MIKHKIAFCLIALALALPVAASAVTPEPMEKAFTVAAGDSVYATFTVEGNGGRVFGSFRATGGSGNDIKLLILDEDGFENWKNGHTVNTYYNSGRITVGRINVKLAPGKYVLVWSNTYSIFTPKAVTAILDYEQY